VYATFDEAKRNVPASITEGYDNSAAAGFYRERLDRVFSDDYPVLFWLRPLIREGIRVFDFGGHVGLHFYAYQQLVELPKSARWLVADVPAVCEAGAKLATERGVAEQLSFGDGLAACDGSDVFLSSGALQYLEATALGAALNAASKPPGHVILNKLPVTDGAGFSTVQDTGVFCAAYTVFARQALVAQMSAAGYALVDAWENPEHHCRVADAPERSVEGFSGFYFRRGAGAAA
jgi:putative methyltransferase (TIGR04325 family)